MIKDLVLAGADIYLRNCNNQLPRHCAKGNYILTKYMKLCEKIRARSSYHTYLVNSQFELLLKVSVK